MKEWVFGVLFGGLMVGIALAFVDRYATNRTLQNVISSCEKHEMYLDKGVAINCMVRKTTML
jgi:hypothetical protein